MCIAHADSIKPPFKRPAPAGPGATPSHLRRPADVWSRCSAAAVPAGTDGCPIHTSAQDHLWSPGDLSAASAHSSHTHSLSLDMKRWGACLQFMGICPSGIWTTSKCITKGLWRWIALWTQVGGWTAGTFTSTFVTICRLMAMLLFLCVIYAQVRFPFSLTLHFLHVY